MSVSTGDGGAGNVSVGRFAIVDGETLEHAERRLADTLGRPMSDEERDELERAHARAQQLETEHGPDYRGFGHPTPDGGD